MSELKQRLQDDMKLAMKAREQARLTTIRLIIAGIKQREIDEQISLDDTQVIATLDKMTKQRRESIDLYTQGDRPELAAKEQAELEIIQTYLPQQLSDAELTTLVEEAIAAVNASGMKDMGQVMGKLKPQIQGRADGKVVSDMVKQKLSGQ